MREITLNFNSQVKSFILRYHPSVTYKAKWTLILHSETRFITNVRLCPFLAFSSKSIVCEQGGVYLRVTVAYPRLNIHTRFTAVIDKCS
jgi:hypothetical protein